MRRVLGYVITGHWGVYGLSPHPRLSDEGVLWANHCTIFSTRKKAARAIQKTKVYEAANEYSWNTEKLHIRRVDSWL
jgi:hypothetical protein